MYKRDSFCGPAGDGPISNFLSLVVDKSLNFLKLNFEKSCENHDIDWEALSVYDEAREQKGAAVAWIAALFGFIMVRSTAIVYKLLS